MTVPDDKFRIFISHKHHDHELAATIAKTLEALDTNPAIDCFVSDDDIAAGTNWKRAIKAELARSHLLIILFTNPAYSWDWCLYEAGLFTRFDKDDVMAVVALYDKQGHPPRPLSNLQGVVATQEKLQKFIYRLGREPWRTTDDWRRGRIAGEDFAAQSERAATTIAAAFQRAINAQRSEIYYPCHRVVLDLSSLEGDGPYDAIPLEARVVTRELDGTTGYTLGLFGLAAQGPLTWGDLVDSLRQDETEWRVELDRRFRLAQKRRFFKPITAGFHASESIGKSSFYVPEIYRLVWSQGSVQELTIILDRQPEEPLVETETQEILV